LNPAVIIIMALAPEEMDADTDVLTNLVGTAMTLISTFPL